MYEINNEDWKHLLLGLQEKLNVTQYGLLRKVGIKEMPCICEWISGKTPVPKKHRMRFFDFVQTMNVSPESIIEFGRSIRNDVKVNGNWLRGENCIDREVFGTELIINMTGEILINTPLLFPNERKGRQIQFISNGENVVVFYKYQRGAKPKPLIIPRHLRLTEDFVVGLGIYMAEGSRNRHPKVTNSEPAVINQAIKFFGILGIKSEELKCWIQLHERSPRNEGYVRKFWSEVTGLNEKNIIKVRIKKSSGSAPVEENGVLHLEAGYIILQMLIDYLIRSLPYLLRVMSSEQILYFLRGAFAGEGYAGLSRTGSLNEISYTSTRVEEIEIIKKLLNRLGVESRYHPKGCELRVFGFRNLEKLAEFDIFRYHSFRKSRVQTGLEQLKTSHIPNLNKGNILNLLKEGSLSTGEVKYKLGLSHGNTLKHLKGLEKSGAIKTIRKRGPIQSKWYLEHP